MKKCLFSILSVLITLSNYAQNVGINTIPSSPPTNTLDINGTLRVRGGTPGTGKVLTSDANGVGSWTTSSANYPRISYDAILALPSPTKGDIAYDNTFDCLRVYTGNKWICTYQNPANYTPNMIAIASAGGGSVSIASSIAVDGLGNVYVLGYYKTYAIFGSVTLRSVADSYDIFVAKYSSIGTLQWVQSAGGQGNEEVRSISVDGSGNVYITGSYNGTATFGAYQITSMGDVDIYVAKYNSSGIAQWVRSAGGTGSDNGRGIALDGSGNIYVTGSYNGTATFGATTKTSAGSSDIFVAKYNSSGTLQWVLSAGGTGGDYSSNITVDGSGNVYLTGSFQGTATFGAITKTSTSTSTSDLFVAKYDPVGVSWTWVQAAGGTGYTPIGEITVDGSGNVYVAGFYNGSVTFGADPITSLGGNDIYLAKYNSNGTFQWVKSAGGTNDDFSTGIVVDGSGNVYVSGYFKGTSTFGAFTKTSSGNFASNYDMLVLKYNSSGTVQWVQSAGATSFVEATCLAIDGLENIYVSGYYQGTATFGATSITSMAGRASAIFVARLDK